MPPSIPVPVRFSEREAGRLNDAAGKLKINRSDLIRLLLETWLDWFARQGKDFPYRHWVAVMKAAGISSVPTAPVKGSADTETPGDLHQATDMMKTVIQPNLKVLKPTGRKSARGKGAEREGG